LSNSVRRPAACALPAGRARLEYVENLIDFEPERADDAMPPAMTMLITIACGKRATTPVETRGARAAMGHCELQPRRTHGMVTRLELRIARWAKIAPLLSFRHQSGV